MRQTIPLTHWPLVVQRVRKKVWFFYNNNHKILFCGSDYYTYSTTVFDSIINQRKKADNQSILMLHKHKKKLIYPDPKTFFFSRALHWTWLRPERGWSSRQSAPTWSAWVVVDWVRPSPCCPFLRVRPSHQSASETDVDAATDVTLSEDTAVVLLTTLALFSQLKI